MTKKNICIKNHLKNKLSRRFYAGESIMDFHYSIPLWHHCDANEEKKMKKKKRANNKKRTKGVPDFLLAFSNSFRSTDEIHRTEWTYTD